MNIFSKTEYKLIGYSLDLNGKIDKFNFLSIKHGFLGLGKPSSSVVTVWLRRQRGAEKRSIYDLLKYDRLNTNKLYITCTSVVGIDDIGMWLDFCFSDGSRVPAKLQKTLTSVLLGELKLELEASTEAEHRNLIQQARKAKSAKVSAWYNHDNKTTGA